MKSKPKSHWNYRVMAHDSPHNEEIYFLIHEVYYTKGKPDNYTQEAVTIGGDSLKGIKWVLRKMKRALKRPILWHGDRFPKKYKPAKSKDNG
jgi:hypothetical protein